MLKSANREEIKQPTQPIPAGSEFYTPNTKPTGTSDFNEVIARLPVDKLYLPKDSTIAQKIHHIVSNKEATCAQHVYDELLSLETEDLRPHLLLLLKGFKVDDKVFSITKALFETLHAFVELTLSQMHATQKVRALSLPQGIAYLRLNNEQTSQLQKNIDAAQSSRAQKTVFFIPIDDKHVQQRAIHALNRVATSLENKKKVPERINKNKSDLLIYYRLLANIKFLSQFSGLYKFEVLKNLVKRLDSWILEVSQYLKGAQNENDFPSFPFTNEELLLPLLLDNFVIPKDIFVSTTVMAYEYHPLMEYQYDESTQTWFFIFLSARMYQWYFEVTQQQNHMVFCYGPIRAQEMTELFLQKKPRLGNLTHYEPDRNHYKANMFHNEHQEFVAAALIHDSGHKHICSKMATSKLQSIMMNWVRLIGEKTKLFSPFGPENTNIPFTAETWFITDQPFPEIFLAKNELEMLGIVFHSLSMHLSNSTIVRCMLMLDMLQSDHYYGLTSSYESLPYTLRQVEAHRERIITIYKTLSEKKVTDPFMITSICIFSMLSTEASAHFTADNLIKHSEVIAYTWQKAKPGNYAELHATLPDQTFNKGPNDKNVYINSFIL